MSHGEPVEIACRWEDVQEEYVNNIGTQQFSKAKVYVDRELENGGYLWYGDLVDVPNPDTPERNPGALVIQKVNRLPTLEGDQFLRWVYL